MAISSFTRIYPRADFHSLTEPVIPVALLTTALAQLTLTALIADVRLSPQQDAAIVEWSSFPSTADIAAVDLAVNNFAGGTTSSAPIELNSFGASTSTSTSAVTKITSTTPALAAGTYQVIWSSQLRMQAVIANTGVEGKMRITRSDGVFVEQTDAWDLNVNHAYNGALTFVVLAGQTLTVLLTFSRLGASGTAEMSGARITIDKL